MVTRFIRRCAVLLAISSLVTATTQPVAYTRYKMFELATLADIIVAGEIVDVSSETFDFAVAERVVGDDVPGKLRVQRFENWMCHHRWTEYARGQQLLLFLRRDPEAPRVLRIMGGGDEGEMPFVGESVITHDAHSYRVRGYDVATCHAAGAEISGSMLPFRELASAINEFRAVCSWAKDEKGWRLASVGPRESAQKVGAFAQKSKLARHLVDEARSSREWTAPSDTDAEPVSFQAEALPRILASEHGCTGRQRLGPGREPDEFGFGLNTGFGAAIACIGDIDANGVEDLAVGAPTDSYLRNFHGALWIVLPDAERTSYRMIEIREGKNGFPAAMNESASLGESVAGVGDLNADGVPDLAVGAHGWDGEVGDQGGVWILFLRKDGTVASSLELGSTAQLQKAGIGANSGFGCSLANLGDLDQDGLPELAIGQDPADFDESMKNGRSVFIVSLGRAGEVRWVRRIHDRTDGFSSTYSWFGDALAGPGDVDGDGVPDLAVSSTNDEDGGKLRGAVWIAFLKKDGSVKGKSKISDWQGHFEGTLRDWSQFGGALCGPGDVDGDHISDLLVGSAEGIWTLMLNKDGTVRAHTLLKSSLEGQSRFGVGGSIARLPSEAKSTGIGIAIGGTIGGKPTGKIFPSFEQDEYVVWLRRISTSGIVQGW